MTRQGEVFIYVERSTLPLATSIDESAKEYAVPKMITDLGSVNGATPEDAAKLLRYNRKACAQVYDVVIVGAGPAGLSAAIHGAAEGLHTLLVEAYAIGGQMSSSQAIENYAGFDEPVKGDLLAQRMAKQARRLGAEILVATSVVTLSRDGYGDWQLSLSNDQVVQARVVVLATGAQFKAVNAEGEAAYLGAGIYYGMTERDAQECGQNVVVIGAGNSAGQAALAFERQGKAVTMLVRGSDLKHDMSQYLVDEVRAKPGIHVEFLASLSAVQGEHGRLNGVLAKRGDGTEFCVPCNAVFVFAGNAPQTDWLKRKVVRDEHGAVRTNAKLEAIGPARETLFAIGDVRSGSTKRVAVAAAEGAQAIAQAWQVIHSQCEGGKCSVKR
jgi:thioredoxin reductase (NADPH)